MSYGSLASKAGHVYVEQVGGAREPGYDRARERYAPRPAVRWASGRLTLTHLSLAYTPSGTTRGDRPLSIPLKDIVAVEASAGRVAKIISFRTASYVVHLRAPNAMAFAKRVAAEVETTRPPAAPAPGQPAPRRLPSYATARSR